MWSSNSIKTILVEFYEHLSKHTKEEVQVLKRLTELELKNPLAYEELREVLSEFDYQAWKKIRSHFGISRENATQSRNFQERE